MSAAIAEVRTNGVAEFGRVEAAAATMGVKLEVLRMTLYLSFPVAMFWISNQAEYFEKYVIQRKREIYPPENPLQHQQMEAFKEHIRNQQEKRRLLQAYQE